MNPRILLVEDDPVSRSFLDAAAEALPATVVGAASCAEALQAAAHDAFDLWLIDANLPDGTGAALLARLRAGSAMTPALAHTASRDPAEHATLRSAGFVEVLVKPFPMLALQTAICRVLGFDLAMSEGAPRLCAKLPEWDDCAARAALKGEQAHVTALRGLFLEELPRQRDAVSDALGDGDVARARHTLHRLRASCGFVGARRLGDAVLALESNPASGFALDRFRDAADALLAAAHD